ncbi:hypothetical protein CLPUN_17310 [Clostridium puniceum]|uniref:DUF2178 domain-containing protein n=1 Tax=Clostridium puniceum TaxID=29367 RepID=A0A1S8TMZ4_9CLOT|nr:hypothetical protein [Clostridium puniceum]OOM79004.1 hypothetical protein CLPUN_17310 [Clostridium puniceum]
MRNIKIYNKKKFCSGIVFLLLSLIIIPSTIIRFNDLNTLRIIKYIIADILCVLFGITEIYRSLSSKCTKEDKKNYDERKFLVEMKSKSNAFNITFSICLIITLVCMIALALTKNIVLGGILIGIGSVTIIMMIAEISSCFYYDKRN